MKKTFDWFFYALIFCIPLAFIFYFFQWVRFALLLMIGLSAAYAYSIIKFIRVVINNNFKHSESYIYICLATVSIILFAKYFPFRFSDLFGLFLIPLFLFFSLRYMIKRKNHYDLKILLSLIFYVLLIIPLFFKTDKGPRKYIPKEWWPESINQLEFRNENWAWWFDMKSGKGQWVPISDSTTVKNGNYTLFFSNGKIREKGQMINGRINDTVFIFDISEKLIKLAFVKSDTIEYFVCDGLYKEYYSTGELREEGIVSNHKKGNKWIGYFKNGNFKWKEYITNKTGWTMKYYENGQIADSFYFLNGLQHGRRTTWYENGKVERISTYVNGKSDGLNEGWYENGQKQYSCWSKNGLDEGLFTSWYPNGNLKAVINVKNGKNDGLHKKYHENGKLKTKGYLKNEKQDGDWYWYDENGKLYQKDVYKEGNLINILKY